MTTRPQRPATQMQLLTARAHLLTPTSRPSAKRGELELHKAIKETEGPIEVLFEKMDKLDQRMNEEGEFANEEDEAEYDRLDAEYETLSEKANQVRSERSKFIREQSSGFVWLYLQQ